MPCSNSALDKDFHAPHGDVFLFQTVSFYAMSLKGDHACWPPTNLVFSNRFVLKWPPRLQEGASKEIAMPSASGGPFNVDVNCMVGLSRPHLRRS